MKVVNSGYKIDLHIHSICSKDKDKEKVSFNTLEHIDTLIEKLNANEVQICAITDHDVFGYEFYRKLKEAENDDSSSIIKVFPGIEFSVEFKGESGNKVIHVIAIFNDEDDEKVKGISNNLRTPTGEIDYDCDMAFSEEKFLSILRGIDIDTVLIAHQKSTLSSQKPYKNDVRILGNDKFQEFIYTDYFEAFEFKNRKNEVFNKNFLAKNHLTANIRFITGSDCHDWREYPKIDSEDTAEFKYTYIKCLPNFRGLVMAITDHRRIKTVNSFFNPNEVYIPTIQMSIDGTGYDIPLSYGINVIIGDNSIGKSLLLHKLTGYRKKQQGILRAGVVAGYEAYLKKNNIEVQTEIPEEVIFAFDMQGEIREKFEQKKLKSKDFLKPYYPAPINADAYKEKVQRKLKEIYGYLEEKFSIELKEAQLGRFSIIDVELCQAESLTFVGTVSRNNKVVDELSDIVGEFDNIKEKLKTLLKNPQIEGEDREKINCISEQIKDLSMKYGRKKNAAERENIKIGLFQAAISSFKQGYSSLVSDSQKKLSAYNEHVMTAVNDIYDLIVRKKENTAPSLKMRPEKIAIETRRVYDYEFNSRLQVVEITDDYIESLFSEFMKKDAGKSIIEMTQTELAESLLRFQKPEPEALADLRERVEEKIKSDFENVFTITQAGTDRTQELSAGFNSKIYFDILSYEISHDGVYIIDQPEDNVSQKAIREYLLDRFKVMGENRQVIIVTHNPQFIVNLDVDNVIYIGKSDDGIYVQSGALEYKDPSYNILDIISIHIEGGLETLRRRWKRYEKNYSV